MKPNDTQLPDQPNRGGVTPPARDHTSSHQAVANMTREQINAIYSRQAEHEIAEEAETTPQSAYQRTHQDAHNTTPGNWQQYHSAWQSYYQKYYERYYVDAVQQAHSAYSEHAQKLQQATADAIKQGERTTPDQESESISRDEAVYELRHQLLGKVQENAKKVRKSRHFIPAVAAFAVLAVFVFLQYNRVIFANVQAYVTPGNINPQNIIVDPNASVAVSKDPRLIIPKINVDVPVDYDAKTDNASQMNAMKNGVAYFGIAGANSKPGQLGNVPIAGHSSNDFTDGGDYKFVFALLERMKKGDTFYLNYKGTRYTYTVRKTKVVSPNDIKGLQIGEDKAMATLITCTPLGTAKNRLLVFGEQVSPSVDDAKKAPAESDDAKSDASIPGNSPTFLQKIFGGGN